MKSAIYLCHKCAGVIGGSGHVDPALYLCCCMSSWVRPSQMPDDNPLQTQIKELERRIAEAFNYSWNVRSAIEYTRKCQRLLSILTAIVPQFDI